MSDGGRGPGWGCGSGCGAGFAPVRAVETPATVETVPVLAPLPAGAPADAVSEVVTQTDVVRPGPDADVAPIPADLAAVIGALAESADPAMTLLALDDADPGAATVDDLCAPRGDAASAEDCPEGLRSTVLALVGEREFAPAGQAYPPTREELLAEGNPWRPLLWCDGLAASDTVVPFGILSGVPGHYTLEYWPSDRPGDVRRVDGVGATEAEIAEYRAALATATRTGDLPFSRTCLELDVEPDTAYTLVINGVDINGRLAPARTERFHSGREPVHPGADILAVGDHYLLVTARHPATETVDVRVVVADPAALPTCSQAGGRVGLVPLSDETVRSSEAEVAAAAAPPHFVSKRVVAYSVPEGSTALVCVRWYPAGGAPSWERELPTYESSAIVQSPDRLNPVVTLTGVDHRNTAVHTIDVGIQSVSGVRCAVTRWTPDTVLPVELCRGAHGVVADGGGVRVWDSGARGDLVATTTEYWGERNASTWTSFLRSDEDGCRGRCSAPPPQEYRLAPHQGNYISLVVSWEPGSTNGRRTWAITPVADVAPERPVPDHPRVDFDQGWTFGSVTFPVGRTFDAPNPYVPARYTLRADRPVDYVVRLTAGTPGVAAPGCTASGEPLERRGRAERPTAIEFGDACLGAEYFAEIELVDDAGHRAVWSLHDRERFLGSAGYVVVPRLDAAVTVDIAAQTTTHSYVYDLHLQVADVSVTLQDARYGRCSADGVIDATATRSVALGAHVRVVLLISAAPTERWHATECTPAPDHGGYRRIEAVVPLASLYAPGGARIEAPDAYRTVITLRASR